MRVKKKVEKSFFFGGFEQISQPRVKCEWKFSSRAVTFSLNLVFCFFFYDGPGLLTPESGDWHSPERWGGVGWGGGGGG